MSKIKCVVPVSGGKDSQACLKLALETFDKSEVIGLFCNTNFEHPLTYDHVEKMRGLYGVHIEEVSDGDVETRCLRYGRFPSGVARFCTDDLKIKPSKRFYENLAVRQGGFQVWYGMRTAESTDRGKRYADFNDIDLYPAHEVLPSKYPKFLADFGVMFRLPIVDWTTAEVKEFVGVENLNPLYEHFDRVGCFPCLAAGDGYKVKAFEHDETGQAHWQRVQFIQQRIGKSVFNNEQTAICPICEI